MLISGECGSGERQTEEITTQSVQEQTQQPPQVHNSPRKKRSYSIEFLLKFGNVNNKIDFLIRNEIKLTATQSTHNFIIGM
jgi:hypothetical protein